MRIFFTIVILFILSTPILAQELLLGMTKSQIYTEIEKVENIQGLKEEDVSFGGSYVTYQTSDRYFYSYIFNPKEICVSFIFGSFNYDNLNGQIVSVRGTSLAKA